MVRLCPVLLSQSSLHEEVSSEGKRNSRSHRPHYEDWQAGVGFFLPLNKFVTQIELLLESASSSTGMHPSTSTCTRTATQCSLWAQITGRKIVKRFTRKLKIPFLPHRPQSKISHAWESGGLRRMDQRLFSTEMFGSVQEWEQLTRTVFKYHSFQWTQIY